MRVELRPEARDDLQDIYRYGVRTFGEEQADKHFDALTAAIYSLAENPESCPRIHQDPDIRRLTLWPHIVLYQVKPDVVTVARIIDGRRDVAALLEDLRKT